MATGEAFEYSAYVYAVLPLFALGCTTSLRINHN